MFEMTDGMKHARTEKIAKIEKQIDERIKRAVLQGQNECYFPCDKDTDASIYDEIRSKYEKAGYKIKPTG